MNFTTAAGYVGAATLTVMMCSCASVGSIPASRNVGTVLPEVNGVSGAASALTIEEAVLLVNPATAAYVIDVEDSRRFFPAVQTDIGVTGATYGDGSAHGALWGRAFVQARPLSTSVALFYNNQFDPAGADESLKVSASELVLTPALAATVLSGKLPIIGNSELTFGGSVSFDLLRIFGSDGEVSDSVLPSGPQPPQRFLQNGSLGVLLGLHNFAKTGKPLLAAGASLGRFGEFTTNDQDTERGFSEGRIGVAIQTPAALEFLGITWFPGFIVSGESRHDFTREMSFPETLNFGFGITYNFGDIMFGIAHTGTSEAGVHIYSPVSLSVEGRGKHLPDVGLPEGLQEHLNYKISYNEPRFSDTSTPRLVLQIIIQ